MEIMKMMMGGQYLSRGFVQGRAEWKSQTASESIAGTLN